jgi:2-haloacid dehalogenase
VFVDDREVNVEAARSEGMVGLLFTDPATLRADLVRLGLLEPVTRGDGG